MSAFIYSIAEDKCKTFTIKVQNMPPTGPILIASWMNSSASLLVSSLEIVVIIIVALCCDMKSVNLRETLVARFCLRDAIMIFLAPFLRSHSARLNQSPCLVPKNRLNKVTCVKKKLNHTKCNTVMNLFSFS